MSESRNLVRERGPDREHRMDRVSYTLKESGFQGGREGKAKKISLGEEEGSMSW